MTGTNRVQVAVLLTCFNRRNKTMECLASLYGQQDTDLIDLHIFLVDDGSTDGTSESVSSTYPAVHIIQGSGQLFWAGGMRLAWKSAHENGSFDYFWLVNDDTIMYPETLKNLLSADEYALNTFGKRGIYVASTRDAVSKQFTYGGHRLYSDGDYVHYDVMPNGTFQPCDLCNANILLVADTVLKSVGMLSDKYTHCLADYDYSLRAGRAGFPVLILPEYGGTCSYDKNQGKRFYDKRVKARLKYLKSPKGYAYKEFLYFTKTFFPKVHGRTWLTFWVQTLFPRLWAWYKK